MSDSSRPSADPVAPDRTQVIHGNALSLPLPDGSVDLVVTSPPYFALRSYRDGKEHYDGQVGSEATPQEFLESLWAATREMTRVLKPTGSIWVNLGDKYAGSGGHNNNGLGKSGIINSKRYLDGHSDQGAVRRDGPDRYNQNSGGIPAKSLMGIPWRYAIGCVDQLGLILRSEVIWSKPNGMPESVTDRVRRSHETWFHLVKSGTYHAALDDLRVPVKRTDNNRHLYPRIRYDGVQPSGNTSDHNPLGRLPGSVWEIPLDPLLIPDAVQEHYDLPDHFAAFPQEWPRRIILGWCPPGGVVLDPFGGTGTTVMVARMLDRIGIHIDYSADYCRLAEWRIFQSGHASKAEQRTWRDRQGEMFEETA